VRDVRIIQAGESRKTSLFAGDAACLPVADIQFFSGIEPTLVTLSRIHQSFLEGLMTHDSTKIPERWLDLLTGYVEVGLIIGAGVWALAMVL